MCCFAAGNKMSKRRVFRVVGHKAKQEKNGEGEEKYPLYFLVSFVGFRFFFHFARIL